MIDGTARPARRTDVAARRSAGKGPAVFLIETRFIVSKQPSFLLTAAVIALALPIACGCGGSDQPEVYPVSGTVIFQGEPIADASVRFIPNEGPPASGQTDASGRFTLRTFEDDDGAVAGEHTVLVSKTEQVDPNDQSSYPQMRSVLPPRYGKATASPLEVTVSPGDENEFPLTIEP